MSLLSPLRFGAAAVLLAGAVQAQVVFEESMTNWAHAGTTGWTDDFTIAGSKGPKVDRLDSTTVLNYTRAIATLKKGHYVATVRIQKFKDKTGVAPMTFEVLGSNGGKEVTIPFSQTGEKDKLLNQWMWVQTVTFTVPADNASVVFRLSNLDAQITKTNYYFDWFKIGRIPEGKALKYQSMDWSYAPWGGAWQNSIYFKDHVPEKSSAFGEVTQPNGVSWMEHRSFYGWNATQPKHDMILQPGTYTYNFRVFVPTTGLRTFTIQEATVAGTTATWTKHSWTPAEQKTNAWQLTPNYSFVVTKPNTPVRFIFKDTSSGGKYNYKLDSFMVRKGAFDVSGTPCKSSLGNVEINGNIPQVGEPFSVSVNNSPVAAVFMIGATTLKVDLTSAGMTGCTLYTAPVLNFASVSTANVSSLTFPIPVNTSLVGVKFREQALVLDPKANKFGAALSTVGSAIIIN